MPSSLPPFEFEVHYDGQPRQLEDAIAQSGFKVHVNRHQQPGVIQVGIRNDARMTAQRVQQILEQVDGVSAVQLKQEETSAA